MTLHRDPDLDATGAASTVDPNGRAPEPAPGRTKQDPPAPTGGGGVPVRDVLFAFTLYMDLDGRVGVDVDMDTQYRFAREAEPKDLLTCVAPIHDELAAMCTVGTLYSEQAAAQEPETGDTGHDPADPPG